MPTYDPAAFITNATSPYFQPPFSVSKLPPVYQKGLYAPALAGLLTIVSCTTLLTVIAHKFLTWSKGWRNYLTYNQYLVLLANLLLADSLSGLALAISFHWLHVGGVLAPTGTCFAQGWLLNQGDVASGLFVLLIAGHTFLTSVKGQRLGPKAFIGVVCGVWSLSLIITMIGPIMHGRKFFTPVAGWCWISSIYDKERLLLRFLWMFLVQFSTLVIYIAVVIHIRKTMRQTKAAMNGRRMSTTHAKIDRVARSMVLYPIFYIITTLPLSASRMYDMAHHGKVKIPPEYLIFSITLLASAGWIDTTLYTLTRRSLIHGGSTMDRTTNGKSTATRTNGATRPFTSQGGRQTSIVEKTKAAAATDLQGGITVERQISVHAGLEADMDDSVPMTPGEDFGDRSFGVIQEAKESAEVLTQDEKGSP